MTGPAVWQLAAIGVAGALCALVLRRQTPELSLVLAIVTSALLLYRSREAMGQAVALMQELAGLAGLTDELLSPLMRTVGVSIVIRLAAQLCRDGGMSSAALLLELGGSLAALVMATPLLRAVLELLEELL